MTYEEACKKYRNELIDVIDVFDIGIADNICQQCIHWYDCPAIDVFHDQYPSDSIKSCKFYEEN